MKHRMRILIALLLTCLLPSTGLGAGMDFYPAWSKISVEQSMAELDQAMREACEQVEGIKRLRPEEMSWENVFAVLDDALMTPAEVQVIGIGLKDCVMRTPEIQQAQDRSATELKNLENKMLSDPELWRAVQTAAEQEWVGKLSPGQRYFITCILHEFRRHGAHLSAEVREELRQVDAELTGVSTEYDRRYREAQAGWSMTVTDAAELEGMPKDLLQTAEAAAAARGLGTPEKPQYLLSIGDMTASAAMAFCRKESTRRAVYMGINCPDLKGPQANAELLDRLLSLRLRKAQLLGYNSYADFVTEQHMTRNGQGALDFVDGLMKGAKADFDAELAGMQKVARMSGLYPDEPEPIMQPWDIHYCVLAYESMQYVPSHHAWQLDDYLEFNSVLRGLFAISRKLFDINIRELSVYCSGGQTEAAPEAVEVWLPGVRVFEISDNKTGQHLGSFYLDDTARPNKHAGPMTVPLRCNRTGANGEPRLPNLCVMSLVRRPDGDGGPDILSQQDLRSLFHEFGHVLQMLLADTPTRAQSAVMVPTDFAELPSTLMEKMVNEKAAIRLYARHRKTGKVIPKRVAEPLFLPGGDSTAATELQGTLNICKLDLEANLHYAERFRGKDLDEVSRQILAGYDFPVRSTPLSVMRICLHLANDVYGSAYYSYLWSEMLALEALERIRREGLNAKTGAALRREILAPFGSRPAGESVRAFLGHDPDPGVIIRSMQSKRRR